MNFGEKLQLLRKARGLSQEALSEQLGVTRQAVSKWELGDATPDLENVVALARFFGVSTDYLLLAAESEETTVEPAAPIRRRNAGFAHRLWGWIGIGIGGFSWLTIWILSTMIQAKEPVEIYNPNADIYEILTEVSYSFLGFVNTYRLSAILWVTGILTALGACLLCYGYWKRRHPEGINWDL